MLVKSASKARICIIGGGFNGLSFLQGLTSIPAAMREGWTIDLLESREDVGGIGLPDTNFPRPGCIPETALYPSVRTNDPGPHQTIPGHPFPPGTTLHPHHWQYQAYHKALIEKYDLQRFIHLNHRVLSVAWSKIAQEWEVRIAVNGRTMVERAYDHIVIATGKDNVPMYPDIPGQREWVDAGKGHREVLHSKAFRIGEVFKGRMAIVVGHGPSGMAIAKLTVPFASVVVHSWNKAVIGPIPGTIHKPKLSHLNPNSAIFEDGSELSTPPNAVIIYCTGYALSFPFLKDIDYLSSHPEEERDTVNHKLTYTDRYIRPLYHHMFANQPEYPLNALAFVSQNLGAWTGVSGYANGVLLGHSILDPGVLADKEEAGRQLLEYERMALENGKDLLEVGHKSVPDNRHLSWAETCFDLIRVNHKHLLPPQFQRPDSYVDEFRWKYFKYPIPEEEAWEHALEIGEEFADGSTEGCVTEEDFAKAVDRLVDWEVQFRAGKETERAG